MRGHVLACALFCSQDGPGLNGLGTAVAWIIGVVVVLFAVLAFIAWVVSLFTNEPRRQPQRRYGGRSGRRL